MPRKIARLKQAAKKNVSDSDSEDDEKMLKNVKVENKKKNDQESDESEKEHESDDDCFTNPSLTADGKYPIEFKLQLLNEMKKLNKRKMSSYKVALKHFDWSTITIDGYTVNDFKACVDEILRPICSFRTLEEMLNDYEQHYQKYEFKSHPDAPKIPRNAVMKFIDDNRAKFKRILSKEFPDKAIGLKEISSYGAKKFAELSEKEQEEYKQQYKSDLKNYSEKKAELLKQCPELVKKRVRKSADPKDPKVKAAKKERSDKKKSELTYMTPFMLFRDELGKEGRDVTYHDAQALYRNLPDDEKMKYIQSLISLDTPLEKQFSSQERKILKNSNGMPQKPLSAYNLFIKDLCKENTVEKKDMLKQSSLLWKTLDEEKKRQYEEMQKKEAEIWHEKMEKWIKELPVEQRAEYMAKYGFLTKVERTSRKRRNTVFVSDISELNSQSDQLKEQKNNTKEAKTIQKKEPEEKSAIYIVPSTPKLKEAVNAVKAVYSDIEIHSSKKKKNIDSDLSSIEASPKKKKKAIESDVSSVEVSPKKKKFKDIVASFGSYPSLKTAHYFMTQKYSGKPHKVGKAYSKLSKDEKKQLYNEMIRIKSEYFGKLKKYLEQNGKDADKVRQFHENNRKEQEECISWHTDYGTDHSDSSDSSDDSDSS